MAPEYKKADNERPCREKQRQPQTKAEGHYRRQGDKENEIVTSQCGINPVRR